LEDELFWIEEAAERARAKTEAKLKEMAVALKNMIQGPSQAQEALALVLRWLLLKRLDPNGKFMIVTGFPRCFPRCFPKHEHELQNLET